MHIHTHRTLAFNSTHYSYEHALPGLHWFNRNNQNKHKVCACVWVCILFVTKQTQQIKYNQILTLEHSCFFFLETPTVLPVTCIHSARVCVCILRVCLPSWHETHFRWGYRTKTSTENRACLSLWEYYGVSDGDALLPMGLSLLIPAAMNGAVIRKETSFLRVVHTPCENSITKHSPSYYIRSNNNRLSACRNYSCFP